MATFRITTEEITNLPPYQTGENNITILNSTNYTFTIDDFTINTIPEYADPEEDDLLKIKIIDIYPINKGTLVLNGVEVVLDDEVLMTDVSSGNFIYKSSLSEVSEYQDIFAFDVADTGSEEYAGLKGAIILSVQSVKNLPPDQVGDGSAIIDYQETLVFTRAMFTTQTTPPFSDPEGDSAYLLKITSLPLYGKLFLLSSSESNSTFEIVMNQVVNFTDIDDGKLVYIPDSGILDETIVDFTFGIADVGSGEFTF